jgi:uncharacterized protein (DUF1800 family)
MRLTRGEFVGLAGTGIGALALGGCTEAVRRFTPPAVPAHLDTTDADPVVWRVLNRAAYGPRPGDIARVTAMGVDAYLEEQLAPQRIGEDWGCLGRVGLLDTLDMDASEAKDYETAVYPEVGKGQAAVELQQAALLRSVYSARQLEQVMVEFWSDHFNVTQLKAECSWLKTVDDRLIRKHALGKFRDLVWASAHSPAMLFYLDNDKNRRRDPKTGSGPNENYARELLELHTLGIHGGYTLKDIQEVARCLSGWGFKAQNEWVPGEFVFRKEQHDEGPKRVLGTVIPAGQGIKDGEQVIDLVCRHPSTARFIARKLCRRFVADSGSGALEARLAETFTRTGGDIKQLLSVLFRSEEFRRGTSPKLKRPFDYAASALRATAANSTGAALLPHLETMGQLPFKWTMPDGYPDRAAPWTPGLLARWNFSLDLLHGRIDATSVPAEELARATGGTQPLEVLRGLSRLVLGRALPEAELQRLARAGEGDPVRSAPRWLALLIASPQFQWR